MVKKKPRNRPAFHLPGLPPGYTPWTFERGIKGEGLPGTKTAFRRFRKDMRGGAEEQVPYSYAMHQWNRCGRPCR